MLTSFRIKNFRGFKELTVGPLERVNLIAGKNNVGKTALLEALWLHHGADNPDLPRRMQLFRGMFSGAPESIFLNLFSNFDAEATIHLSSKGDWGEDPRELAITWEQTSRSTPTLIGEQHAEGTGTAMAPTSTEFMPLGREVVFSYKDETRNSFVSKGRLVSRPIQTPLGPVNEIGLQQEVSTIPNRPTGRFLYAYAPGNAGTENDNVSRYSTVVAEKRDKQVLSSLKIIEPRLVDLKVITEEGRPSLWGDTGLSRLVPLALMGGGVVRLLSIVLALTTAPKGMVLVDEIESGFHHTVLSKVWKTISALAREYDVQVFATTHSQRTIQAAYDSFNEVEATDFRLHRLDRIDGSIRAITYDLETLGTALETGLEVR